MPRLARDPLLSAAKIMLTIFEIVTVFSIVLIVIGAAAVLTFRRADVLADLAAAGAPAESYVMILAGLLLVVAFLLASLCFVIQLKRIVNSVHEGDPFQPANAARLTRMAVYALVAQVSLLALGAIGEAYGRFGDNFGGAPNVSAEMAGDTSLTGVALALVLFILARVFRHGAAMREDLEGTV